jgi:hypothetical protein
MINPWAASVATRGLGATVKWAFIWGCALLIVGGLAFGLISGKFWTWRAHVWKDRAVAAAADAKVERKNADDANAGARNATVTRERIDLVISDTREAMEASATKIEDKAAPYDESDEPVDADVLAEIEAAEKRAAAAGKRIRGKR